MPACPGDKGAIQGFNPIERLAGEIERADSPAVPDASFGASSAGKGATRKKVLNILDKTAVNFH